MKDWALLLRTRSFRTFWLALLVNNLASWSVIAALPILIAGRFGAGMALVLSLGLRVIPRSSWPPWPETSCNATAPPAWPVSPCSARPP